MFRILISILLAVTLTACGSNSLEKNQTAKDNLALGMAYLENNNLPLGEQKLNLAIAALPENPQVLGALALYYDKSNQEKQADQYYQQAIHYAKNNPAILNNYAAFLCQHKHYKLALSSFDAAIKQANDKQLASYRHNAGICALKAGDAKLATNYLDFSA